MLLHVTLTEQIHVLDYLLPLQFRLEICISCFLPNNVNITMYIILNLAILHRVEYDIQGMLASLMSGHSVSPCAI
jgi:hypothetical protein